MTQATENQLDFSALPAAGLGRRIASMVYDLLLLTAISLGYALVVFILRMVIEGAPEQGQMMATPPPSIQFLIMVGWWFTLASYFNWCWKKRGQTLAMKTWRLRLQQPDGSLATAKQRWNRCLITPVSIVSVVGLLWCLFDKEGHSLHDRINGTRVVLLPKKVN